MTFAEFISEYANSNDGRLADGLLLFAYYASHRQAPLIDDRNVLRHPIEEEMVIYQASGISLDDFIADWQAMHRVASVSMLRRRWFKVKHLLDIYKTYSS